MKSNISAACKTTIYEMCMLKRNAEQKIFFRQKIVRYTQTKGIKPAARHFGCSKNTVRKWLRGFLDKGASGLKDASKAPLSCPHKTNVCLIH